MTIRFDVKQSPRVGARVTRPFDVIRAEKNDDLKSMTKLFCKGAKTLRGARTARCVRTTRLVFVQKSRELFAENRFSRRPRDNRRRISWPALTGFLQIASDGPAYECVGRDLKPFDTCAQRIYEPRAGVGDLFVLCALNLHIINVNRY